MSKKQFEDVFCKYGAPMGRREELTNFSGKVRCFKVKMIDHCYDDGGCYWGGYPALPLYCATTQKGMVTWEAPLLMFTRQYNRKDAKKTFQARAFSLSGSKITWIN